MAEDKNKQKHERAAGGKINMKNLPSCQYSRKHRWNQEKTGVFCQATGVSSEGQGHCWWGRGWRGPQLPPCLVFSHRVLSDSLRPLDWSPPGSSVPGVLQARILDGGAISSSTGSSWPGIEPSLPALAGRFFTTEPAGRPSLLAVLVNRQNFHGDNLILKCCFLWLSSSASRVYPRKTMSDTGKDACIKCTAHHSN